MVLFMKCFVEGCNTQIPAGSGQLACDRCIEELVATKACSFEDFDHKPILIGLGYKMQHGKGEVAKHLVSKHNFVKFSFAGKLKDAVAVMYGWPRDMLDDQTFKETVDHYWGLTPRKALQVVGQHFRDNVDEDFWVKAVMKDVINSGYKRVVFDDMRYPNEVEAVRGLERWVGRAIKVDRLGFKPDVKDDAIFNHPSETSLDGFSGFDYTIVNGGSIKFLQEVTDNTVKAILKIANKP